MEQPVRVIETIQQLGGRRAFVYVFCLPPPAMNRRREVLEQMRNTALPGVAQFSWDDAGVLIYVQEGVDNFSACLVAWEAIDRILQTGLELSVGYSLGSFFRVHDYGRFDDATTYAELLRNPLFVLPYMEATSAA